MGHALAVELEPGEAAVDVGLIGVGGDGGLKGFESGKVLCVGCVAKGGGGVKGRPAGRFGRWAGVDDGCGCGVSGGGAVAVADDVPGEDADDDEEEDVVAGLEAHG